MLNSLQHPDFSNDAEGSDLSSRRQTWRIWLPGVVFIVMAALVLARVAWIQTRLPQEYMAALTETTVEEEILPARDGRILAGATVVAEDRELYELQVHYRWLEKDINDQWLRRQIRDRLSRDERKDESLVQRTEQTLLDEKESMLQAVCDLTQTPRTELDARRVRIEQQVRRIIESVNRRAEEAKGTQKPEDSETGNDIETSGDSDVSLPAFAKSIAESIREALTTSPEREASERLYVREEEAYHTVLSEITPDQAAVIAEHPEQFPGVRVQLKTQRVYPMSETLEHVTGARTKPQAGSETAKAGTATTTETTAKADTSASDRRSGRFGIEMSYNNVLSGQPGVRRIVRDRRQRIVSSEIVRRPASGSDVVLSIDVELQMLAEQLLAESLGDAERILLPLEQDSKEPGEQLSSTDAATVPEPEHIPVGGSIVVMDAHDGQIVAAASAPGFDLSLFVRGSEKEWAAVNSDTRRPFVSRFSAMALPPGSTFKILTSLAALRDGTITPEMPFDCQGYLNSPDENRCLIYRLYGRGHGRVTLKTALAESCNVYFFDAARRMGVSPLLDCTEEFQFGKMTGVDVPYEQSGTLPRRPPAVDSDDERRALAAQRRFEREATGLSIGQSRLTTTPLQMARLMAFVANGGWLVTPRFVSHDEQSRHIQDNVTALTSEDRIRLPGITEEHLRAVRSGLIAAVEEPIGTGFKTIRVPGIRIAGKTGTAEAGPGKPDHAWFAGFFPADAPEYVIVVTLEHGGSGSKAAGPLAREVIRSMLERGLIGQREVT
ncbi:MAG: hypothetical protein JNM43_14390, partial [Planctomycetaceae bacterium]|nr:hypothetical protein [Planctomycetaceae bacterium]